MYTVSEKVIKSRQRTAQIYLTTPVEMYDLENDELIDTYESIKEAEIDNNLNPCAISKALYSRNGVFKELGIKFVRLENKNRRSRNK